MCELERLYGHIRSLLNSEGRAVVAIDGMCAAGKTTLAARLAQAFGGEVIHADDFFLPIPLRTPERYAEPGGNIDYERFSAEVICGLSSKKPFSYGVFDCKAGKITERKEIKADGLIIAEGAYCMRPEFRRVYDITVFCGISEELQKSRILARDGEDGAKRFAELWIPLENRYIAYYGLPKLCGYSLF